MATTLHPSDMNTTDLAARREKKVNGFYIHLLVFVLVNGGLLAMNYSNRPDHMWSYWVLFGWGIGIVSHAVRLFCLPDRFK